jgi:hypothetical protein
MATVNSRPFVGPLQSLFFAERWLGCELADFDHRVVRRIASDSVEDVQLSLLTSLTTVTDRLCTENVTPV